MSSWPDTEFASVPDRTAAERLALTVRAQCLGDGASEDGWCDLRALCSAARASVRQRRLTKQGDGTDALLIPRANGSFTILVDPVPEASTKPFWTTVRHRNRFRVAHELGHTFFYRRRPLEQPSRRLPPSQDEESFCDSFAAALLVPPARLISYEATPDSVFSISDEYEVSVEVAGRALAAANPGVSVMGLLWSPNPRTGEFGLRIAWSASQSFIPKRARFRSTATEEVMAGASSAESSEELALRGLSGPHEVRAMRLPERRQVVVVAHPEAPTRPLQREPEQQLRLWEAP